MTTAIEWCEETWNPVVGCSCVSPGCTHCYAMPWAANLAAMGVPQYAGLTQETKAGPVWTGKVGFVETALDKPLRRRKPTMYFVNSMSDAFHEGVSLDWLARIWRVMAAAPQHTFQILTKRPERMAELVPSLVEQFGILANVWLGTSVEDSARLFRLDALRRVQAAVRFVSFEPLLGSVAGADLAGIGWVIVGGESGPRLSRPFDLQWARQVRDLCKAAGIPFFMKQMAGATKRQMPPIPADLFIREWPERQAGPARQRRREPQASACDAYGWVRSDPRMSDYYDRDG